MNTCVNFMHPPKIVQIGWGHHVNFCFWKKSAITFSEGCLMLLHLGDCWYVRKSWWETGSGVSYWNFDLNHGLGQLEFRIYPYGVEYIHQWCAWGSFIEHSSGKLVYNSLGVLLIPILENWGYICPQPIKWWLSSIWSLFEFVEN